MLQSYCCIDKLAVNAAQSIKCLQLHALYQSLLERQIWCDIVTQIVLGL